MTDDPSERTTQPNGLAAPQTISAIWLKDELAAMTAERDKRRTIAAQRLASLVLVRSALLRIDEQLRGILDDV